MATLLGTWLNCWDGRSRFAVIGLCLNLVETPVEAVCVYCLDAENFSRVFKVTLEVLADTLLYCNVLAYLLFWELAICLCSMVKELFAGLLVSIVCSMSFSLIFSLSGFISDSCPLRPFMIKSYVCFTYCFCSLLYFSVAKVGSSRSKLPKSYLVVSLG